MTVLDAWAAGAAESASGPAGATANGSQAGLGSDGAVPTMLARRLVDGVERVVRGRREAVQIAVSVILGGGHLLVEDLPGSGKTTIARALAQVFGGSFRRIQGTPDLMAAEITGSSVWEPESREFRFVPGPVFANVVLVDELNRTPPRTQSALLEAMDERTVTVDGVTHSLPDPFILIATQNPHDQWGTYPLPEGQLDRFAALLRLGQNTTAVERQVLREQLAGPTVSDLGAVLTPADLTGLRRAVKQIHVSEALVDYVVALTAATREHPAVAVGASTRAGISLLRCSQAVALLNGRSFVSPDDVKWLSVCLLAHRLGLASNAADAAGARTAAVLDVLNSTPAPLAAQ